MSNNICTDAASKNDHQDTQQRPCPCQSGYTYGECCRRYIECGTPAPTAEALMRSRYSAYATGHADYLCDTHHSSTLSPKLRDELPSTLKQCHWTGLKVVQTTQGQESDTEGRVRFEASFTEQGKHYVLKEYSRFVRENGRWYYIDGDGRAEASKPPVPGRNDPCWCGSGKKFKKCHG